MQYECLSHPSGSGWLIGHVNNIPAMTLLTGAPRLYQSNCYIMILLTEHSWEFQNDALWKLFNMLPICMSVGHTKLISGSW